MRYPFTFVAIIAILATLAAYIYVVVPKRRRSIKNSIVVANVDAIKKLPEYRHAKTRYRALILLAGIIAIGIIVCNTLIISRPVRNFAQSVSKTKYDFMICIDTATITPTNINNVLGEFTNKNISSMTTKALNSYLNGANIGVTFYHDSWANYVPLTDDYGAIANMAISLKDAYEGNNKIFDSLSGGSGSINITGVAGCVDSLLTSKSNNQIQSAIIITTPLDKTYDYLADYASESNVRLYGVSISTKDKKNIGDEAFESAVIKTGGKLIKSIEDIKDLKLSSVFDEINETTSNQKQSSESERPQMFLIVLAILYMLFAIIIWRLKI